MRKVRCNECDELVDYEDYYRAENGKILCPECYRQNTFRCAFCEEKEWQKYQHILTVVFDADEADVETGVYKINDADYYAQGLIGSGWLKKWAIEKIAELPPDAPKDYYYPCGHLCRECQKKITTPILTRELSGDYEFIVSER